MGSVLIMVGRGALRNVLIAAVISAVTLASGVACIKADDTVGTGTATATSQKSSPAAAPAVPAVPLPGAKDTAPPLLLSEPAPPPDPSMPTVVVIGDSYTGGSAEGGVGVANWTSIVWSDLARDGIDVHPQVSGAGGSGYLQPGTAGTTFGGEAARLVRPYNDVVVFFGGANDASYSPEAVSAAAKADFDNVRTVAPDAVLLVIGPTWPNAYPDGLLKLRDAVRDQAIAAGAVYVDPLAERWFSGTPPNFIGADRIHPTDAGHAYLAQLIEPHIRDALASSAPG